MNTFQGVADDLVVGSHAINGTGQTWRFISANEDMRSSGGLDQGYGNPAADLQDKGIAGKLDIMFIDTKER
jgi:hypothetical protein